MKLELNIKQQISKDEVDKLQEIVQAIVSAGGHGGVRGGKTILHFDGEGNLMACQLDYTPWRRRNNR